MGNSLVAPSANKALKKIKEAEKLMQEMSKFLYSDEDLELLTQASDALNIAKLRISKARGWF